MATAKTTMSQDAQLQEFQRRLKRNNIKIEEHDSKPISKDAQLREFRRHLESLGIKTEACTICIKRIMVAINCLSKAVQKSASIRSSILRYSLGIRTGLQSTEKWAFETDHQDWCTKTLSSNEADDFSGINSITKTSHQKCIRKFCTIPQIRRHLWMIILDSSTSVDRWISRNGPVNWKIRIDRCPMISSSRRKSGESNWTAWACWINRYVHTYPFDSLPSMILTPTPQVEAFAGLNQIHDNLEGQNISYSATKADYLLLACRNQDPTGSSWNLRVQSWSGSIGHASSDS